MTHGWRHLLRAVWPIATVAALAAAAACATAVRERTPIPSSPAEPSSPPLTLDTPPALAVEAIVTDRRGVPAENLRVRDFEVSVDGKRRVGLALARLYRGPGAELLASSRTTTSPGEVLPIAEPSRVMVVVDQASFAPGDELRARAIADAWLGLLGLSDRAAVVVLPLRAGASTVAFDGTEVRKTLGNVRALRLTDADALAAAGPEGGGVEEGARTLSDDPRRSGGIASEPARGDPRMEPKLAALDLPGPSPATAALDQRHATATLAGLRQVLSALGAIPGGKTVLLLSSGLMATNAAAEARAIALEAARAQARIFVLQVPTMVSFGEAGARDLHLLAQETGGFVVPPVNKPDAALQRLAGQLAFSYLLLLAPMPGDADPSPHALQVSLQGRSDLIVQAPKQVSPGRVSAEDLATALSPKAAPPPRPVLATGPGPGEWSAAPVFPQDAALERVLARVSQYVWDYGQALTSVVAEEIYTQEVHGESAPRQTTDGKPAGAGPKSVTLASDYLLVKVPGVDGWFPFRDVFAVNGQPVRDRQDRLMKLFLEAPSAAVAVERAKEVWLESARYNIGSIHRTINAPLLPLWFLEPRSVRRFTFRKAGEETLSGTRVVVIEFAETVHPTFIKTPEGFDVLAQGKVWVDPINGRIHRTLLKATVATITVDYGPCDEVPGLWLPVRMEERYVRENVTITGKASYSKFRQFQVTTSEQIALPKK